MTLELDCILYIDVAMVWNLFNANGTIIIEADDGDYLMMRAISMVDDNGGYW